MAASTSVWEDRTPSLQWSITSDDWSLRTLLLRKSNIVSAGVAYSHQHYSWYPGPHSSHSHCQCPPGQCCVLWSSVCRPETVIPWPQVSPLHTLCTEPPVMTVCNNSSTPDSSYQQKPSSTIQQDDSVLLSFWKVKKFNQCSVVLLLSKTDWNNLPHTNILKASAKPNLPHTLLKTLKTSKIYMIWNDL